MKTPGKLDLTVGDWDLSTVNDGPDKKVVAEKIIVHSAYSRSTLQNDVALVKLASTIQYADDIKPICLPTTSEFIITVLRPHIKDYILNSVGILNYS